MSDYLTIREATALLDDTRQWLHKLRKDEAVEMGEQHRQIPGRRERIFFHRATFLAWLENYNATRRKLDRRTPHD